jgi:hypothetical protein
MSGQHVDKKTNKTRTSSLAHSGAIVDDLDAHSEAQGGVPKSENTYEGGNFFFHGLLFECSRGKKEKTMSVWAVMDI